MKRKRRSRRSRKASRIARVIRSIARIVYAFCDFVAERPVYLALPLIVCMLILAVQMHISNKQLEEIDQKIQERQQQIEQETKARQNMEEIYGCSSLYGVYEFPWNTMSQDWEGEQVEGFYYHDISADCKAAGGELPTIIQVYTYIVCQQKDVDYEMVFALIERESSCRWDVEGDGGASVGLMQIQEKWHKQRMEKLGMYDLKNPFQNVMVGVDYLAEIQQELRGTVPDKDLPYYVLSVYNYGMKGAREKLWKYGVVKYKYNTEIMDRAEQLKKEKEKAEEQRTCTTETH